MAKVEMNAITEHFRGRLGDVVFRRQFGRLVSALRPKPTLVPPSANQVTQRLEFRKAVSYAKDVIANPATRVVYEEAGLARQQNAFSTAVGDYFTAPLVQDIDLSAYRGLVGDKIAVMASDDVTVMSVHVLVRATIGGAVLEQGAAVLTFNKWLYTATTALSTGQSVMIEVTAKDRPGNEGTGTQAYP